MPGRHVPCDQIGKEIPELAIDLVSFDNTSGEFHRKREDYFPAGVRLAWVIDPRARSADVYTAPDDKTALDESGTLDGGDMLPGFRLPLAKLFARLEKPGRAPKRKKK
jgi:Uma2 family endonuclease